MITERKTDSDPTAWAEYLTRKSREAKARRDRQKLINPEAYTKGLVTRNEKAKLKYAAQKSNIHGPFLTRNQRAKLWKTNNPDRVLLSSRTYNSIHVPQRRAYWLSEKAKQSVRVYAKNRDPEVKRKYFREYTRKRRSQDPMFRVALNLRRRINDFVKGKAKAAHTFELIGVTQEQIRCHIESQFLPGMTWDNYGRISPSNSSVWNVDHIMPCDSFDFSHPEQQRICFHYSNLRPMWALDNFSKGAKVA